MAGRPLWRLSAPEALRLVTTGVACAVTKCGRTAAPVSGRFLYIKLTCEVSGAKLIRFRNARPVLSSRLISKRRQAPGAKRWVVRLDKAHAPGSCGGDARPLFVMGRRGLS